MNLRILLYTICIAALCSCNKAPEAEGSINSVPPIVPDYIGVTMPVNMAAPRFELPDTCNATAAYTVFSAGDLSVAVKGKGTYTAISLADWHRLTEAAPEIKVSMMANIGGKWLQYEPFEINISPDSIDSYLAYRLIEPGYETWNEMGIYQRCLENYDQSEIISNKRTDYGCVNCHSFCDRDPGKMLFHMRVNCPGTYIIRDGDITRLNTKTPETISSVVYPSWHPSGDYVSFSTNTTKQMFHTTDRNRIEVMDYASDVVVLDTRNNTLITSPLLSSQVAFETFPTFSPDGKSLYYCSADTVAMPGRYSDVKYSVCRIDFDAQKGAFGTAVDTLYKAQAEEWGSASFPRVSPDGRWLMITLSDYGNFSIWHRDADIYMIDLASGEMRKADALNSDETESYHSWSSNGRWVVVSSRRADGLYTRPYIAHVDANGNFSKPFVLPQDGAGYYDLQMKSYNVPEFIKAPVATSPSQIAEAAHTQPDKPLQYVNRP